MTEEPGLRDDMKRVREALMTQLGKDRYRVQVVAWVNQLKVFMQRFNCGVLDAVVALDEEAKKKKGHSILKFPMVLAAALEILEEQQ